MVSRQRPDWVLVKRIVRYVHSAPGGGLHRTELAERAGVPASGELFRHSLLVAYQYKRIDFCGQHVTAPACKSGGKT
jgi:hypothetical protein